MASLVRAGFFLSSLLLSSVAYCGESKFLEEDDESPDREGVDWVIDTIFGKPVAEDYVSLGPEYLPDLRQANMNLKLQKGDLVIVPIPVSNPTLGTGLIVGGAYFYGQTVAEQKTQPPSVTGGAAFKSSNGSTAFGIGHQSYFAGNKWRIGGVFGRADMDLALSNPADEQFSEVGKIGWRVEGNFISIKATRRISGQWYAGLLARYIDMRQTFSIDLDDQGFSLSGDARSAGLGFTVERDNRDAPMNSFSGSLFEIDVFTNTSALGSDNSYRSYSFKYRSYHRLASSIVLAWEAQACARSDKAPLWDACRINLRGFSSIDYLGKTSTSAQVEARWQFKRKWGVVAFAGGGLINDHFTQLSDREVIPSYGIGLRFMVLESQRINFRLDYARSVDSDAFYISVGEAF